MAFLNWVSSFPPNKCLLGLSCFWYGVLPSGVIMIHAFILLLLVFRLLNISIYNLYCIYSVYCQGVCKCVNVCVYSRPVPVKCYALLICPSLWLLKIKKQTFLKGFYNRSQCMSKVEKANIKILSNAWNMIFSPIIKAGMGRFKAYLISSLP